MDMPTILNHWLSAL